MDAPYQRHSDTSKAAADLIRAHLPRHQHLVLCIFRAHPDTAFTDNDLIEFVIANEIPISMNGVRARRIELLRKNLITECGIRAGDSGRLAKQYRLA
jgi:hypothetical protein